MNTDGLFIVRQDRLEFVVNRCASVCIRGLDKEGQAGIHTNWEKAD